MHLLRFKHCAIGGFEKKGTDSSHPLDGAKNTQFIFSYILFFK